MTAVMIVRGVPKSLARDGWWLNEAATGVGGPPVHIPQRTARDGKTPLTKAALLLAVLIGLGDFLFYGQDAGLSVALFAYALFAASIAVAPSRANTVYPAILMGVSGLPVIDHLQPLSVMFVVAGLVISVAWIRQGRAGLSKTVFHLIGFMPFAAITGFFGFLASRKHATPSQSQLKKLAQNWAFPVGGGLILLSLLMQANPIVADWFEVSYELDFDLGEAMRRMFFWGGLAMIIWPLLSFTAPPLFIGPLRRRADMPSFGLNTASVANALIVFNLLLGVQTALDLALLWGGGPLPDGMSFATYARRGAYPLLVTALLAGGFALAARAHVENRKGLFVLVMLWLGQNLFLTLSAAYRLSAYVDAYGLTYLRLYAAIWMVLVGVGLLLIGWYIHAKHGNGWLIVRGGSLAIGTLYLAAFVNFAHVIGAYNLAHPRDTRGVDHYYICNLGPMAAAVIANGPPALRCINTAPEIHGWRDWGYRSWRVNRLLAARMAAEDVDENISGR